MSDIQDQLAQLRQRIARIDRKYAKAGPAAAPAVRCAALRHVRRNITARNGWAAAKWRPITGATTKSTSCYERHRRHGSIGITDLEDLPLDLLHPISNGRSTSVPPAKWAFLDTETTGLAGGAGTYAFLIGVGSITPRGLPGAAVLHAGIRAKRPACCWV